MSFNRKERVEVAKDRADHMMFDAAEQLFACGEQLRETAMNLHREWHERMRCRTQGRERLRLLGYGILVPVLQALAAEYLLKGLAAEYLLKGLAARDKRSYLRTHNLQRLYEDLDPAARSRLAPLEVSDIGTKLPEFLEAHCNDFVNWRYVAFERGQATTHHLLFDKVLAALIDASNQ